MGGGGGGGDGREERGNRCVTGRGRGSRCRGQQRGHV